MKTVIAGLEEGLNAIAEALEGGGSEVVPTPTAADEGKVLTAGDDGTASWEDAGSGLPEYTSPDDSGKILKLIEQDQQGNLAPEWSTPREVPAGGSNGQVLTKNSNGYGWAAPSGGLPALDEEDNGKALIAQYDSDTEATYPAWSTIRQVPSGGTAGQVLTKTSGSGYGWAAASGGGGNIDVLKIDLSKSDFSPSEGASGMYDASVFISGALTKINNMISISVVDNVDSGTPTFKVPASDDDCSIFYDSEMTTIRISSTIYNFLGTRQANHFYLTYYTGA